MSGYRDLLDAMVAQRDLQRKLGYHFEHMTDVERITYIRENILACTDELHEALDEVGWKSWATSKHINTDAYLGELRDAWQFITNLMLVAQPNPVKLTEWFLDSLAKKHGVNRHRADSGYDGVSTKCPKCSRALEDVSINEIHVDASTQRVDAHGIVVTYYCVCGYELDPNVVRLLLVD